MDYATDSDSLNGSFSKPDSKEGQERELIESLKECLNYYRQKNMEMEDLIKTHFGYLKTPSAETKKAIDELQMIQENLGCKDITVEATLMSATMLSEQLRKKDDYIAQIKLYTKLYQNLNEKYSNYIKFYQNELEKADCKIDQLQLSNMLAEITSMRCKKERCERKVLEMEEKCPWLKHPQMNIPSITKEIEVLNQLKLEKLNLESELKEFEDLKPNLLQAQEQLGELKQQYDQYKM